ncbi:MAG TPA: HAMP domain-containing sensor histidine kinase [Polyangiaceae bacterium]
MFSPALTAPRVAFASRPAPAALDPVLDPVVNAAALRGERFVSISRIVFCVLVLARFISVMPPSAVPYAINLSALCAALLCSAWILKRIREQKASYRTLTLSIVVDAAVCFLSLLQTSLWPAHAEHYRGLLTGPDPAALLVIVYASGLRVWPRLAVVGAALNLGSYLLLLAVESVVWGERLAYGRAEMVFFLLCLGGVMALSIATAQRSLSLLTAGARNSVQVDRARREFAELVREHHDARSVLSAAALASDMMVRAIDDSRPVDSVRRHAERLRDDVATAKSCLASLGDRAYDHMTALAELQLVDTRRVLDTAIVALRSHFPDITLHWHCPSAAVPHALLVGGSACLQRVVYNLVSNAREGDGRRGAKQVTVRVESTEQGVRLCVEDDGPGFAAPALESGGVMPASTKPAGMGLGLLMTRELVRASGGKLTTTNLQGGGASVGVVLRTAESLPAL